MGAGSHDFIDLVDVGDAVRILVDFQKLVCLIQNQESDTVTSVCNQDAI